MFKYRSVQQHQKQVKAQAQQKANMEYTLQNYIQHYKQLVMYSKNIDNNSKPLISEKIELICEYSVWGDQNDTNIFDYFFEENIAEQMFKIMQRSQFKQITIVVIQSFAILLSNLSNKDNIVYLLSHPVLNEIIQYNYDFTDEEIVDYYISLLKSVSLRIDESNIHLFFNQRVPQFPLVWQALKFYNHREIMVRTAVRTILLGVMKVNDQQVKIYFTRFPFILFYAHFACYLKFIWLELNKELSNGIDNPKERFDDQIDLFYFLNDLYQFCPEASEIIDNALLAYGLLPSIFSGILYQKKESLGLSLSLYLANYFITNFGKSNLSDSLTLMLFSPQIQNNFNILLENNVRYPRSFMFQWSFNNFWDQHMDVVLHQSGLLFDRDEQCEVNITQECREELGMIHDVLGLKGAIGITYCCKQLLNNNGNNGLVSNKIRNTIMQYLQTKDDNLLYLLLQLWKTVLMTKSEDILRVCLLKEANTSEIVEERNQIIQILLKVYLIDPPLRLCTMILMDQLPLTHDTLNQLHQSYQYCIIKMKNMLKQPQFNDMLISQYPAEQQQYSEKLQDLKPNLDYLAFKPLIDTYNSEVDLIYRTPIGLKETANRDLAMFLMVDKIYQSTKLQNGIQQEQSKQVSTNEWIIGKNYEPDSQTMLSCRICAKSIRDKLQQCTSGECFWIEDEENFIVVETQIVKQQWALILYNYKLKDVEAVIDRGEPRILTVSIKIQGQSIIKESYIDVQLYFDDSTYAVQAKKHIDDKRKQYSKLALHKIQDIISVAQDACDEYYKQTE